MKKKEFIRFRFKEFLKYIEIVSLTKPTLRLQQGRLSSCKSGKRKTKDEVWECVKITHDDLRGVIVHSTPKNKEKIKIKEELIKDLEMKRNILRRFKQDPLPPIKDLLRSVAKKYL